MYSINTELATVLVIHLEELCLVSVVFDLNRNDDVIDLDSVKRFIGKEFLTSSSSRSVFSILATVHTCRATSSAKDSSSLRLQ